MKRARQILEAETARRFLKQIGKQEGPPTHEYVFKVEILTGIDDSVVWSDEVVIRASTDNSARTKAAHVGMDQIEFDDRIDPRLNVQLVSKERLD